MLAFKTLALKILWNMNDNVIINDESEWDDEKEMDLLSLYENYNLW